MDESTIAVFIQQFKDFMEHTIRYRDGREALDKATAEDNKQALHTIFSKLTDIQSRLDKLPCDAHVRIADEVHKGFIKDIDRLTFVTYCIWTVVGVLGIAILGEWIKNLH